MDDVILITELNDFIFCLIVIGDCTITTGLLYSKSDKKKI